MKKPSARRVIAATCTPGRPNVVRALFNSSSRPANAPLNTCSLAFGKAMPGCSPVALELLPGGGMGRVIGGGADVETGVGAFGAGAGGGGGDTVAAFFAAMAATAEPGVITIVFS